MNKGPVAALLLLAALAQPVLLHAQGEEDTILVDDSDLLPNIISAPTPPEQDSATAQERARLVEETLLESEHGALLNENRNLRSDDKHVVSNSRMFSVSGGDASRMGAIATLADNLRSQLCRMTGLPTKWKYIVTIRLVGQSTDAPMLNPIRLRLRIIDGEPNIQIRVFPGGGINVDELRRAIITASLYEYALHGVDLDAFEGEMSIPHWLVTGIVQAIFWRSEKIDRQIYINLFERAEMLSPEQIVSYEKPWELDAHTLQVYEASCSVLILALVNQEGGQQSLLSLIDEAATGEGTAKEIITRHFHTLGLTDNALSKWWALELANLSIPKTTEALTPVETERRLVEALLVRCYDKKTRVSRAISFDDVYTLVEQEDWEQYLRPNVDRLVHLSIRCFPGYRPIIEEYCRAVSLLLRHKDPNAIQALLGSQRELREAYITTSIRARDYLDWYEITQIGSKSTSLDSYRDAMAILRGQDRPATTSVSQYLEDIEDLFTLKEFDELPKNIRAHLPEDAPKKKK